LLRQEKRALADKHKTSHSGFVYYRYFPRKEKVGSKRGLTLRYTQGDNVTANEECPNNLEGIN